MMLRVLDLFSGIGGFSLGLERTGGFKTVAFCEIESYPRKVLAKHWPEVPCYHDIRELTADRLAADGIEVDVICGGFPCQDISVAGKGAGLAGERSGLWSKFARLIGELRPRYVIVENVSALLSRGLADVLGDLAEIGFDAEWHCIPASAIGAPHRRDRIWIIAHANCSEWREDTAPCRSVQRENGLPQGQEGSGRFSSNNQVVANAKNDRTGWRQQQSECSEGTRYVANADNQRELQSQGRKCDERGWIGDGGKDVSDASSAGLSNSVAGRLRQELALSACGSWWLSEPNVGRVAHGVPSRVDRLKGLGNAVVPQIPELIGRAILEMGT